MREPVYDPTSKIRKIRSLGPLGKSLRRTREEDAAAETEIERPFSRRIEHCQFAQLPVRNVGVVMAACALNLARTQYASAHLG